MLKENFFPQAEDTGSEKSEDDKLIKLKEELVAKEKQLKELIEKQDAEMALLERQLAEERERINLEYKKEIEEIDRCFGPRLRALDDTLKNLDEMLRN